MKKIIDLIFLCMFVLFYALIFDYLFRLMDGKKGIVYYTQLFFTDLISIFKRRK